MAVFQHITQLQTRDNIPGMATIGYYAPKALLENFPEAASPSVSMSDYGRLESEPGFVFEFDGFSKIFGVEGTGKVTFESQGTRLAKSFLNKFSFVYPGLLIKAKGLCRQLNNSDVVFVGVTPQGKYIVIGHPDMRTLFKVKGTTGDKRNSEKGITIEASCTHQVPAPVYEGSIPLSSVDSDVFLTTDSGYYLTTDSGYYITI